MDSDDELMVHLLMEEEGNTTADVDENLAIIACLLQADDAANAQPKCGGSKFGMRKTKPRMKLGGH